MPKLFKPSAAELEAARNEAIQNMSEKEWIAKCCSESARILRSDPLRYRSYGPYWWLQKQAMIEHGITEFGEFVDAEWHEFADYGTPFLNLLAALMYSNAAMDAGLIYSNSHNVAFVSEDSENEKDIQVYTVADDEMELLALEKNLL